MRPRVLVLGGAGMLGHRLWLALRSEHDAIVTLRGAWAEYEGLGIFQRDRSICCVDAMEAGAVERALSDVSPDTVVNAIGIVKQLPLASDPLSSIAINALLPHRLEAWCRARGSRLIQISTDCVFSGLRGSYSEDDVPDAVDLYGRTKALGEVAAPALTLRTSMIGRELSGSHGLLEWFLGRRGGRVRGYRHGVFSGLTTMALARLVSDIINQHVALQGLYHVAAAPINKADLLRMIDARLRLGVEIEDDEAVVCDRSLDGKKLEDRTGFVAPTWAEMLDELCEEAPRYEQWRKGRIC